MAIAAPLALAPPALAVSPIAFMDAVDVTGAGTANVLGHVNPRGSDTSAFVEYGLQSSQFCISGGSNADGKNLTAVQQLGSANTSLQVTFAIGGLAPGQAYCFHLVATNGVDPDAEDFIDNVFAGLPQTRVYEAHSTASNALAVSGIVDANGQATTVSVQYDTQGSLFCDNDGLTGSPQTSTASTNAGSANGNVDVTVNLTGPETGGLITPGAKLCVTFTATNGSGASPPEQFVSSVTVGAAEVRDQDAYQALSPTSQRVTGQIWTAGQDTTVRAEYAEREPSFSAFCANDGLSGAHQSTSDVVIPGAATEQTAVATISGLDPAKRYCFRWVADNASATGATLGTSTFYAGGPEVTTDAASGIGSSSATLNGTANAGASAGSAYFEYDVSGSLFCQSGGVGSANFGTTDVALAPNTATPVAIAANILSPQTAYCFRLIAGNDRASTHANLQTFTTTAALTGGGGDPGGGGNPGGGGTTGGTTGAATNTPPPPGPFDTLIAALTQYDLKLATLRFAAVLGKSGSKVSAKVTYKKKLVAALTKTAGPGTISFTLKINKAGKRLFRKIKKGKIAKLQLQVTVTPPGGSAITKKSSISFKRAKDPCVITKASAGGRARAAC